MKVHKVYRSKDGNYFACDLSVGRATEAWEDVTCPDCLAHKAPPVSPPLDYALSSLRRAADAGQPWSVSPDEAAALVAEVERLRAEVGMLQQEARIRKNLCDGLASEAAEERAAVVAWLRGDAGFRMVPGNMAYCDYYADAIERGEHRREGERWKKL